MTNANAKGPAKARCNRASNPKVKRIQRLKARGVPYTGQVLARYGLA